MNTLNIRFGLVKDIEYLEKKYKENGFEVHQSGKYCMDKSWDLFYSRLEPDAAFKKGEKADDILYITLTEEDKEGKWVHNVYELKIPKQLPKSSKKIFLLSDSDSRDAFWSVKPTYSNEDNMNELKDRGLSLIEGYVWGKIQRGPFFLDPNALVNSKLFYAIRAQLRTHGSGAVIGVPLIENGTEVGN